MRQIVAKMITRFLAYPIVRMDNHESILLIIREPFIMIR